MRFRKQIIIYYERIKYSMEIILIINFHFMEIFIIEEEQSVAKVELGSEYQRN